MDVALDIVVEVVTVFEQVVCAVDVAVLARDGTVAFDDACICPVWVE